MTTNSNSSILADIISESGGSFVGLVQTLKGTERLAPGEKRGGNKLTYGDDKVHVSLYSGFSYSNLCQRSLNTLSTLDAETVLAEMQAKNLHGWDGRGEKATPVAITKDDVQEAINSLSASWTLSRGGLNESTNDHVFEPLIVDGEVIKGCRVYKGQTPEAVAAGKPAPATPGTIYLHGLQISRRVLVPAPNGPVPESKSSARVVAETFITKKTPMAAYRSYRLQPDTDFTLRAVGSEVLSDITGIKVEAKKAA